MNKATIQKAAFLATNGFCEREYTQAYKALSEIGLDCRLVSLDNGLIKGWNEIDQKNRSYWGHGYAPDKLLEDALSSDYEVLVIPGGIRNVEKLKLNSCLKPFISAFIQTGKPVFAYNRAIDLLSFTGLSHGYELASSAFSSEILNAKPEDAIIMSGNLVTISGYPDVHKAIQEKANEIMERSSRQENKAA